ncbi:unnamed protein product [Rhodiola kirilowii]
MSQLITTVSEMKKETGRLPSQTIQNPKANVSMMEVIMIDDDKLDGLEELPKHDGPMIERALTTSHKVRDPGAFTVTCGIGEAQVPHCLIDLGATINAMPYSVYNSLGLGPLSPPKLMIELGDKSCIRPVGLLEDVTLQVGDLVIHADFYVLQMGNARDDDPPTLILGRPFLYDTKARIDMGEGLLSLSFGGRISDFYICDNDDRPGTKKPPNIVHTSDFSTLVPDRPRETVCTTGATAMVKTSSPTWRNVKANPPDYWIPEPCTPIHKGLGRIKGDTEAMFDLTRPWDPNKPP